MQKSLEIELPSIPNFLKVKTVLTSDKDAHVIPIQEFTDKELKKIGKEWTEKLLEEAAKKRKA